MDSTTTAEERLAQLHRAIHSGRYDALFTDTPPSPQLDSLANELADLTANAMPGLNDTQRAAAQRDIINNLRGAHGPSKPTEGDDME